MKNNKLEEMLLQSLRTNPWGLDLCICAIANSRKMLVADIKEGLNLTEWREDLDSKVKPFLLRPLKIGRAHV